MSSFWDRIKPAQRAPAVTDARVEDGGLELQLVWDDGFRTRARAQALRQACPCAACVDEWTRQRTLDVTKVPADLRLTQANPVGNYALALQFSDGHGSGIFTWAHLRELTQP